MSFADFAAGGAAPSVARASSGSLGLPSAASRQAIDSATLKLEQFQRQVLAIKRAADVPSSSGSMALPPRATRASSGSGVVDDDLHDRIRFACLLQEEIAKVLTRVPADSSSSLLKRKLCKDFEVISTQLESAVVRISAREQAAQQELKNERHEGNIVVEHDGQVLEFAELESEIAHNEALIEEREQDLQRIHSSVTQVNEIFRDLAAIVADQQTAIDDIEMHVHESMQQTQHGLDEVKKASEMQSSCVLQ